LKKIHIQRSFFQYLQQKAQIGLIIDINTSVEVCRVNGRVHSLSMQDRL